MAIGSTVTSLCILASVLFLSSEGVSQAGGGGSEQPLGKTENKPETKPSEGDALVRIDVKDAQERLSGDIDWLPLALYNLETGETLWEFAEPSSSAGLLHCLFQTVPEGSHLLYTPITYLSEIPAAFAKTITVSAERREFDFNYPSRKIKLRVTGPPDVGEPSKEWVLSLRRVDDRFSYQLGRGIIKEGKILFEFYQIEQGVYEARFSPVPDPSYRLREIDEAYVKRFVIPAANEAREPGRSEHYEIIFSDEDEVRLSGMHRPPIWVLGDLDLVDPERQQ